MGRMAFVRSGGVTKVRLTLVVLLVLGVFAASFVAIVVYRPPGWVLGFLESRHPSVLFRVDTDEPVVALTIDDAPHPAVTPGLLEVLRRYDARATFFILGENAELHPELVQAIHSAGHELANHLFYDRVSARLPSASFLEGLRRTDERIRQTGAEPRWCRPGSGWINDRIRSLMEAEGYRACLASAYPVDIRAPFLAASQMLANARPGAILVLHDGSRERRRSIEILEETLPKLRDRGLRVVSVSALIRAARSKEEVRW